MTSMREIEIGNMNERRKEEYEEGEEDDTVQTEDALPMRHVHEDDASTVSALTMISRGALKPRHPLARGEEEEDSKRARNNDKLRLLLEDTLSTLLEYEDDDDDEDALSLDDLMSIASFYSGELRVERQKNGRPLRSGYDAPSKSINHRSMDGFFEACPGCPPLDSNRREGLRSMISNPSQ